MSIDQSNFDPTRAPAREDVISRGVRARNCRNRHRLVLCIGPHHGDD